MSDCLFCKIASGEIKTDFVHEEEGLVAFKDINPQAPLHIIIIPRKHVSTLNDLSDIDAELVGRMVLAAKKIAVDNDVNGSGYRTVFNCNADGGQSVFHLHLHLLAGRRLTWPPG